MVRLHACILHACMQMRSRFLTLPTPPCLVHSSSQSRVRKARRRFVSSSWLRTPPSAKSSFWEREAEVANLKAALKSDGKKKEEAELSRREAAGEAGREGAKDRREGASDPRAGPQASARSSCALHSKKATELAKLDAEAAERVAEARADLEERELALAGVGASGPDCVSGRPSSARRQSAARSGGGERACAQA